MASSPVFLLLNDTETCHCPASKVHDQVTPWLSLSERQLEIHFCSRHPGKESRNSSANDRDNVQSILSLLRAALVKTDSGIWFPCYEVIVIV